MKAKADLHVHSKYSREAPEWFFRKIGFPHGTTEPEQIYEELKEQGMDFVTITDHDTIEGCLEIAHHPDVFVSEEITARFPDDHCQIHLLAWDVHEGQHTAIQSLRRNIFELRTYLSQENIPHAVAHPLRSYDAHFDADHFEKLLLLFRNFETINGLADSLYSEVAAAILDHLRPEHIERLAEKHGIEPTHPEPWRKATVGGSNDHAALQMGVAYTETPFCTKPSQFVRFVREGKCAARGTNGTPVSVSHGMYKMAFSYLQKTFLSSGGPTAALLKRISERFLEGENPTSLTAAEKFEIFTDSVWSGKLFELAKSGTSPLFRQIAGHVSKHDFQKQVQRVLDTEQRAERRAFLIANLISDQLAFHFFEGITRNVREGRVLESLEQIGSATPLLLALTPYVYAFQSQTASQTKLNRIAASVLGEIPPQLQKDRRAWFTDTLYDVNGVSTTIRKMASEAVDAGKDLTVITCSNEPPVPDLPIRNFTPIGEFDLPEYEIQRITFPPILKIVDYVQSQRFTELILSTPGPLGLCGLIAAKVLGLKVTSIYHTDFPQYVNILTDDSFLETISWRFMHWFYDQCDRVYVNSEHYREIWIERGIRPGKILTLPRGLDTQLFHADKRDRTIWQSYEGGKGVGERPLILYAGRVSREKDLDILADAIRILRERGLEFDVAIVGDGPYLKTMRKKLPQAVFTGYLKGEALAAAYASADIFAFPSTTDTYGNVVVEAQASGLPCVVSDLGGPKDLVEDGRTGYVTRALDRADFAGGLQKLLEDPERLEEMRAIARASVAGRDWTAALEQFWNG